MNLALGIAGQNRDYRSLLGLAARLGLKGAFVPRVHWGVDVTVERFGDIDAIYAPCINAPCPDIVGAATFVNATALLMLREEEGAAVPYFLAGGGLTRLVGERSPSRRTYGHMSAGVGWDLRWQGTRPFVELRFTRYLPGAEPMSGWSMPVLIGLRF